MVVFAVSFLAGGIILLMGRRFRTALAVFVLIWAVGWNLQFCHPEKYVTLDLRDPARYLYSTHPHDAMEYLPKSIKHLWMPPVTEKMQPVSGDMVMKSRKGGPLDSRYTVLARTPSLVIFHVFNFPGWGVFIDGAPAKIVPNDFGLIMFLVPPGEHEVRIVFLPTPVRTGATVVSVCSLILWLLLAATGFLRTRGFGGSPGIVKGEI
jgi:hypothetical protein